MPESITQPLLETKRKAQQIAWLLREKHGSERFAWIEHKNKIFYSVLSRENELPMTAVTQLIQYLFDEYIDHSFFILRERIFTTEPLTPLCQSMIRTIAKRVTAEILPQCHGIEIQAEWIQVCRVNDEWIRSSHREKLDFKLPLRVTSENVKEILREMKESIPRGKVLHDYNRAIAAILCDPTGKVLSYATNNNSKNKTLHAEVCLMQDYWSLHQKAVPAGSVIYTSLKPCRMCSDIILKSCEDNNIQVHYLEEDLGPLALNTSLEKYGLLKKL